MVCPFSFGYFVYTNGNKFIRFTLNCFWILEYAGILIFRIEIVVFAAGGRRIRFSISRSMNLPQAYRTKFNIILIDINYFLSPFCRIFVWHRYTALIEWKRKHVEISTRLHNYLDVCAIELQCRAFSESINCFPHFWAYACVDVCTLCVHVSCVKRENRNLYQDNMNREMEGIFTIMLFVCDEMLATMWNQLFTEQLNCKMGLCMCVQLVMNFVTNTKKPSETGETNSKRKKEYHSVERTRNRGQCFIFTLFHIAHD